jgi:uncharacterized protein YecT (DUF1311 family)
MITTVVVVGVLAGAGMGGKAFLANRRAAADSAVKAKERADSIELAEAAKLAPKVKKGARSAESLANPAGDAPPVGPNGDVCASTARSDQLLCFTNMTQHVDADVERVMAALIVSLRKQAHIRPADSDPPIVERLRDDEKTWLADREHGCPALDTSPYAGRDRAKCFADRAAKRVKDLQQQIDAIPPG